MDSRLQCGQLAKAFLRGTVPSLETSPGGPNRLAN
jgi:hypothetical protein